MPEKQLFSAFQPPPLPVERTATLPGPRPAVAKYFVLQDLAIVTG